MLNRMGALTQMGEHTSSVAALLWLGSDAAQLTSCHLAACRTGDNAPGFAFGGLVVDDGRQVAVHACNLCSRVQHAEGSLIWAMPHSAAYAGPHDTVEAPCVAHTNRMLASGPMSNLLISFACQQGMARAASCLLTQ